MKNKLITSIIIGIFLLSFTSALDCWTESKQGTTIDLIQKCPSCSYVNITTITYPNGTVFMNDAMTKNRTVFNYTLPDSSQLGKIIYSTIGDKNGANPPLHEDLCIEITPDGRGSGIPKIIAYITLILIFAGCSFLIYKDKEKMSDEQYWNKMFKKYREKNYIKLSATMVWYNLKKNSYILHYFIGYMIMIIAYDITLTYNLGSVSPVFKVLLFLYAWGSLIVAMIMFSKVQEWIMEWKEEIENINWGVLTRAK